MCCKFVWPWPLIIPLPYLTNMVLGVRSLKKEMSSTENYNHLFPASSSFLFFPFFPFPVPSHPFSCRTSLPVSSSSFPVASPCWCWSSRASRRCSCSLSERSAPGTSTLQRTASSATTTPWTGPDCFVLETRRCWSATTAAPRSAVSSHWTTTEIDAHQKPSLFSMTYLSQMWIMMQINCTSL